MHGALDAEHGVIFRRSEESGEWQDCACSKESCQDGVMPSVERGRRLRREARRHVVAALVNEQVAAFELGVVHEVFGIDRSEYADPWYEFRVVACTPGPVRITDGQWTISTPHGLDDLDDVDTLVVPAWYGWNDPMDERLVERVRAVHDRGGRVVSVCSGAFLLARAHQKRAIDGNIIHIHQVFIKISPSYIVLRSKFII